MMSEPDNSVLTRLQRIMANPVRILAFSFAAVILLGAMVLTMPLASREGLVTPFIDALFTATSAVCVTGLVTVDTGTYWSLFGTTTILSLIQIGGLGFMSFATLTAVFMGRRLGLKERLVMQEAYNALDLKGIIRMVKYVVAFTFGVELVGALILMTQFIPSYGLGRGIYVSFFQSISAFCNAGFDLFGNYSSLTGLNDNKVILIVTMTLIAVAGLGFSVWLEIFSKRSLKQLSLHARLVISITVILIFGGALLLFLFEFNNPATLGGMSFANKLTNALFSSITPRTAGFNSIDLSGMTMASRLLTIILMFIGGSPGSTAGGIKTTAAGVLILTVITVLKGRQDPEAFGRRITKDSIYKAFAVVVLGMTIVLVTTIWMSFTEASALTSLEALIFEATSAFATVGLTEGITPGITSSSKAALILAMYFGRVGPITVLLALSRRQPPMQIKYPEGRILIG